MASSSRACTINKCEISSCAVCHCCQKDLCLDHIKEHKDQLNSKLIPLANQINTFLDSLEHFNPNSLPSFQLLEQWRVAAHVTVDRFYQRMHQELFERRKSVSQEKLRGTRNHLDQLIQKQGATRENLDSLTKDIRLIEQEIDNLQTIEIHLRPLIINENEIMQSNSFNRQTVAVPEAESDFQIFVQIPTGRNALITVKPSNTIKEVKEKIEETGGVPIEQQRLTYMGKQLMDGYTIATYGIQRQFTLQLRYNYKKQES